MKNHDLCFCQPFICPLGFVFGGQVPSLLNLLLLALAKMLLPSHIEQALLCVRRLALTHFNVAVEHLLAVPLPLPGEAIRMFITIAKTPDLVLQLLNMLLSTLNDSPFSEDKPVPTVRAVRHLFPCFCSVCCQLRIVFIGVFGARTGDCGAERGDEAGGGAEYVCRLLLAAALHAHAARWLCLWCRHGCLGRV